MDIHEAVTAHFRYLATLSREQFPIATDNKSVIIAKEPDQESNIFRTTFQSLPENLRGEWVVRTGFPVSDVTVAVCYQPAHYESLEAVFGYHHLSADAFRPIDYPTNILGSNRVERKI